MSDYTHKQVLVLRTDLNMRKGKMCSQAAHASLSALLKASHRATVRVPGSHQLQTEDLDLRQVVIPLDERVDGWLSGRFTKICVGVASEAALLEVYDRAQAAGLLCALIQDAGLTEFDGVPTYTAVGIGPDLLEKVNTVTQELKLL